MPTSCWNSGQHDADDEQQAAVGEQLAGGFLQRGVDFREHDFRFVRVGELGEHFARLLVLALEHEAARRFRNEEQQQHEDAGRNGAAGQHPAPAFGVHPVRVTVAAELLDEVVHEVRHRDAADDRDLLVGHQRAALGRRRDLGDVHRREHRGEADAHAAEEAMADEVGDHVAEVDVRSVVEKQIQEPDQRRLISGVSTEPR